MRFVFDGTSGRLSAGQPTTGLIVDVAIRYREIRLRQDENDRLKVALHDWQAMHAQVCVPVDQTVVHRVR